MLSNRLRRYFAQSKESDELPFFAFSTAVDEDAVVARGLAGPDEGLDEVGDLLEESGDGTARADASGRPYLLCRVDSAAA